MDKNSEVIKELCTISDRLFILANSLAGKNTGPVAIELHNSSNSIRYAIKMINDGIYMQDIERQVTYWATSQLTVPNADSIQLVKRAMLAGLTMVES